MFENPGLGVLFGNQDAHRLAVAQAAQEGVVSDLVEPLHHLALHVDLTRLAEDVQDARPPNLRCDDLGRQCHPREQPTELSARRRMQALTLDDVLLNREDAAFAVGHEDSRWVRS